MIIERVILWIIALAAVVAWLMIYQYTARSPIEQGMVVLVSILCCVRRCGCRCGKGEKADV